MKHIFSSLFLSAFAAILFSCGERNAPQPKPEEPVQKFSPAAWFAKDTSGVFRGADFGDEAEVIRLMENDTFLVASDARLLKYDYPLPGARHYELTFQFRKNRLASFSFDAYLTEQREGEELTEDFRNYLTGRFGAHQSKMGIFVWSVPSPPDFKEAFLELEDESAEFGYGKVNISAYAIRK